jgi:hypothetical protein
MQMNQGQGLLLPAGADLLLTGLATVIDCWMNGAHSGRGTVGLLSI